MTAFVNMLAEPQICSVAAELSRAGVINRAGSRKSGRGPPFSKTMTMH